MNAFSVLVVLMLPALLGAPMLWLLEAEKPGSRSLAWLDRCGAGWLLGVPLCGAFLRGFSSGAPVELFSRSIVWLLLACVVLWVLAVWKSRRAAAASTNWRESTDNRWPVVWWLLLCLIGTHWLLQSLQAYWLPTLTWDAWTTWLGKPKAWSGGEAMDVFQTLGVWSGAAGKGGAAALAPHYPESIPRYLMLLVSAHGQWSESLVHAPWIVMFGTFGIGLYAALRRAGMMAVAGMGVVYAIFSLPLVDAHLALAGYLDFWIAAALGLSALSLWRWRREGGWQHLVRSLLFAAILPLMKLEGAVWLLIVVASMVLLRLPPRLRLIGMGIAALVLLVGLPLGGVPIPAPGLGMIWLRWGELSVPGFGDVALGWHPVLGEVLASLLLLPNWHLLWWMLPVVALVRWKYVVSDQGASALGTLLLAGLAFVGFLFFFTDAAAWAKNLTSINRIVLQVAPVAVLFIAAAATTIMRRPEPVARRADPAPVDTGQSSVG